MQSPLYQLNKVVYEKSGNKPLEVKNFEIHRGTVYAISGKPASGKSVFLDVLTRNIIITSGQLLYEGKEISQYSKSSLNDQIAYVKQINKVPWGTVEKYILKILDNFSCSRNDKEKRLVKISNQMEIKHLLNKPMKKLTPGQLRWVILAANIAVESRVLVIDEIEQHLSPDAINNLCRILYRKSNYDGITVIIATQNAEILKKIVTIFITMNNGRITSVRSTKKQRRYNRKQKSPKKTGGKSAQG